MTDLRNKLIAALSKALSQTEDQHKAADKILAGYDFAGVLSYAREKNLDGDWLYDACSDAMYEEDLWSKAMLPVVSARMAWLKDGYFDGIIDTIADLCRPDVIQAIADHIGAQLRPCTA